MNHAYRFARTIYRKLPFSLTFKEKIKGFLFSRIPYWHSVIMTTEVSEESLLHDRRVKLLSKILPASQNGLEIGPLCFPIVKKTENDQLVKYVDYATADELREHYRNDPNVRVDEIVETDYIWGEYSLPELVGNKKFDYCIASHVIEHIPDMLGWLREIAEVLNDRGILSLAIPDKRYSFDFLRELSTPGMIIEAYLRHQRRPGPQELFDHLALACKVDVTMAWNGTLDKANLQRYHNLQQAFDLAQESLRNKKYHDVHVNIFTPASFLYIIELASQLGLFDFAIVDFYNTAYNTLEFFVSLQRLSRDEDKQKALELQMASFSWARTRLGI